ncbi:MAG: DNA glycosylase [Acutalibacteraceae bacterium]|jgi:N-glycosylase/DNA lyase
MKVKQFCDSILIENPKVFSLSLCLDCGQAFRWEHKDGLWHGVVKNKVLKAKEVDGGVLFYTTLEDYNSIWHDYFDLARDYEKTLVDFKEDEKLKQAINEFCGIRILNQDPWEALCSFIISQNNNIPRIKGIIKRLCETFGEPLGEEDFAFPSPQTIAKLSLDDLAPLRAGFRNKYILDAAQKVATGEVDIYGLKNMSIETARSELIKIKGVGEKVAECTLLYGCGHINAFPKDVWVKRIMQEMYQDGLPKCTDGVKGIAQQYLFHWRRNSKLFENEK